MYSIRPVFIFFRFGPLYPFFYVFILYSASARVLYSRILSPVKKIITSFNRARSVGTTAATGSVFLAIRTERNATPIIDYRPCRGVYSYDAHRWYSSENL